MKPRRSWFWGWCCRLGLYTKCNLSDATMNLYMRLICNKSVCFSKPLCLHASLRIVIPIQDSSPGRVYIICSEHCIGFHGGNRLQCTYPFYNYLCIIFEQLIQIHIPQTPFHQPLIHSPSRKHTVTDFFVRSLFGFFGTAMSYQGYNYSFITTF